MIQSNGLTIDKFYIPPFTVNKGEMVVIELPNGAPFMEALFKFVDVLTRRVHVSNVIIDADFKFADHFVESRWLSFFRPMTIGRYIKRHANPADQNIGRIYDLCDVKPSTQIVRLPGTQRKLLSILTALSWTNNIIFDLMGVDPMGGMRAYSLAKEIVSNGGSVILLDNCDEFKNDCSWYVKFQIVELN
jgi:hypothetical protein